MKNHHSLHRVLIIITLLFGTSLLSKAKDKKKLPTPEEIKTNEVLATSPWHWEWCVEQWISVKQNKEAERCLKEVMRNIKDSYSYHFAACASLAYQLNNKKEALRLLKLAEEHSNSSWDWTNCAKAWKALGNKKNAKRCLEKAESKAKQYSWNWKSVAEGWLDFGDKKRAI